MNDRTNESVADAVGSAAASNPAAPKRPSRSRRPRTGGPVQTLYAQGEPMVWLTGGALVICMTMILGMVTLITIQGGRTFWPVPLTQVTLKTGETYLGEITRSSWFEPGSLAFGSLPEEHIEAIRTRLEVESDGLAYRRLFRTGNFELTDSHFHWVNDFLIEEESTPEWALMFERRDWGRFYGLPISFIVDGEVVAEDPQAIVSELKRVHPEVRRRLADRRRMEAVELGRINRRQEQARLAARQEELAFVRGRTTADRVEAAQRAAIEAEERGRDEHGEVMTRIRALNEANERYVIRLVTADGIESNLQVSDIVRFYAANRLSTGNRLSIYFDRWREFLLDDPREANTEGGVFPAIFGTVVMTLIMTIFVVPFGVLAALYLREYAKAGPIVSAVRIAVNNLAGVPSIVFGVFGLGFFCYIVGAGIDNIFYESRLPTPTFGKGGILWASATLALLTLPVVIVATEEALAAVPSSMREGSYACGASKWQTIRRIVLPRAMPGIMTGMILAMARGAGEVAPLMLVGAVKLAPDLPIDWNNLSGSIGPIPTGPLHAERSFMHLGFHIFDVGFQSPNSEAAKPMVYTTTLLLIMIIFTLNMSAIWLRSRLKRRFAGAAF